MPNCPFTPLAWPYRPCQVHLTSFCAFHHPPKWLLTLIYATCLYQAHSNTKLQHWIREAVSPKSQTSSESEVRFI